MKKLRRNIAMIALSFLTGALCLFGGVAIGTNADEQPTAPLFSVSGGNSSVHYGKHATYAQDKEGLLVSLSQGDTFRINKAIDLSGKTKMDKILSLFPTPTVIGTSDAHFLAVTFTDAYDPTNFVTVTTWDPWQDNWGADHCYVYTYPAGRNTAGLSSLENKIQKDNTFGTEALVSFSGQGTKEVGKQELYFSFEYDARQLYSTGYTAPRSMVADYDDTDFYDELWYGFTTGEVFISIEAGNFKTSAFHFMITEIADLDLRTEKFTPDKKPALTVDVSAFGGEKPQAIVGEKMPFMPAETFSIYDNDVKTKVQVTRNGVAVETDTDGFVPQTEGEYLLHYVATDKYGNATEQTIALDAVTRKGALVIVPFGERQEFLAGKTQKIAKYCEFGGTAIGKVDLRITASLIGGDEVYEIDPETLEFTPRAVGAYVITYEYGDYLGSRKEMRVVNVLKNDEVFLYEQSLLPDYFIKGAKYRLEEGAGYTFKTGVLEEIKAKIHVTENGVTRTLESNVYEVLGDEQVVVTYEVENGANRKSYSKAVKVVDVGYTGERRIEKYFDVVKGDVVGGANEEKVFFDFAKSGEIRFINDLQGVSFYSQFSVDKQSIGGVNVFLTDSQNPKQTIKLTYTMKDGKTQFSVNDGAVYNLSAYNMAAQDKVDFTYDDETQSVRISKTQNVKVKTTVKGEPFDGFTSSKVKVSYALFGVEEPTRFSLYKINNQPMYDISMDGDIIRPEIIASHMRGERKLGETVTLHPLVIGDVLDPYVTCLINVTDPNGEVVVDNDGVSLKNLTDYTQTYTFTLTQMGAYTSKYVIEDGAGNRLPNTAKNTVVDKEAPTLTVQGTPPQSVKVGEKTTLPSAVAQDVDYKGVKTELDVYVWIEGPDGTVENVTGRASVTLTTKGKYVLTYYTIDENGNSSTCVYCIQVTE